MPGQVTQFGAQGLLNFITSNAPFAPPAAPTTSTATTGGTVLAGTYLVEITYTGLFGETAASTNSSQVTTGTTSTITINSPTAQTGATGWYAYVTQAGGSYYYRQQAAGSPTSIGTNLVITAPPTTTGASAPPQFLRAYPSLFLALLTGNPATSGPSGGLAVNITDLQEDTTSGYVRQAVTFAGASATVPSTTSNTASLTFGAYGANQAAPVQWAALVTVSTGTNGLLLYTWTLDTPQQVLVSQFITIPPGALQLSEG